MRAILKCSNGAPAISFPPQEENQAKSSSPVFSYFHEGLANQSSLSNRNAAASIILDQTLISVAISYFQFPNFE